MVNGLKGISVACTQNDVFVRVVGRGTFQNSQPLRRFALDRIEHGSNEFVVDLGDCQSMDSTFLGVLAGIGLRLKQTEGGRIFVLNINTRNRDVVCTLGLDRLFCLDLTGPCPPSVPAPAEETFEQLPDSDVEHLSKPLSHQDTAGVMLDAHEDLVRVDERNEPKFRSVTELLRDQAKEQQT